MNVLPFYSKYKNFKLLVKLNLIIRVELIIQETEAYLGFRPGGGASPSTP